MSRRFQFSLQAIFLLTFMVSLPCGWHAWRRYTFEKPFRRINALRALGGNVDVHFVYDMSETVTGDGATATPRFNYIALHLADSKITDKEMVLIEPLATLRTLDLRRTNITDAGLKFLRGLHKLTQLELQGTLVTDTGVADLQKQLPNCTISR